MHRHGTYDYSVFVGIQPLARNKCNSSETHRNIGVADIFLDRLHRMRVERKHSDIHLADGSSFKIFEKVRVKCPIIFTTAYDQYAIQAFKVNSIDYLLKPIKEEDLKQSLVKYRESSFQVASIDVERLMDELRKSHKAYQERFIVQFADKLKSIEVNSIAYFVAMEKAVFLISSDGHRYAIDYTIERLDEILNPKIFYRVNRKFIVNFTSIKGMYSYSKSRVKIDLFPTPETEVIVSSERASGFKEWLNQ